MMLWRNSAESCGSPGWSGKKLSMTAPVPFFQNRLWCTNVEFPDVPEYPSVLWWEEHRRISMEGRVWPRSAADPGYRPESPLPYASHRLYRPWSEEKVRKPYSS